MNRDEFLSKHLETLERDQPRYNLMLGILNRTKDDPSKVRLWSFGEGAACALQTPPLAIILGDLNTEQSANFAEQVKNLDFNGCMGADDKAEVFSKQLAKLGVSLELSMPQRIYVLEKQPLYPKCEGAGRRANAGDLELFLDWFLRFSKEAVPHETPQDRSKMTQTFKDRPVFFWEVNGTPVSMAVRSRETRNGSNISLVYTPLEHRGKGFAGSATAYACEDAFKDGKSICFLYTDLRNPVSNRVYQKIGFRPWCDSKSFIRAKA